MELENQNCVCGKKRINLNDINWKRHLDFCKRRKLMTSNRNQITNFFSKQNQKESEADQKDLSSSSK